VPSDLLDARHDLSEQRVCQVAFRRIAMKWTDAPPRGRQPCPENPSQSNGV